MHHPLSLLTLSLVSSVLSSLVLTSAHANIPQMDSSLRSQVAQGILPSPEGNGALTAWGGTNPNRWMAEAVLANAASQAINRAWRDPEVRDVLVAVPVKFKDSGYNPYGDGQTNAEVLFNSWSARQPPLVAILKIYSGNRHEVEFHFDSEMRLPQSQLEISYRLHNQPGTSHTTTTLQGENAGGALRAVWKTAPQSLNLTFPGQLTPIFVRPSPGYGDWFPVYFRMPRHSVSDFIGSMPEHFRKFPGDGKSVIDPENLRDTGDGRTAMEKAFVHPWPSHRYNVNNIGANGIPQPYIPDNVHARLGANGRFTAVGKGFTWVSERNTHFKQMYTGFERRNRGLESEHGVPSGSGWHVMGDTITLINHEERVPFLVGAGFTNPALRFGIQLPSGDYSYGLQDVAVMRLLFPGEAFVTVPTLFRDRDQDLQWYAIHTDHDFLAEEWVSPTRPQGDNPAFQ